MDFTPTQIEETFWYMKVGVLLIGQSFSLLSELFETLLVILSTCFSYSSVQFCNEPFTANDKGKRAESGRNF